MGRITLSSCFVSESNRIGPEGAGAAIAHHALELERTCILASQVGRMQRQLELSVEHAKSRRQFDQPVGNFQAVSHRIAEMRLRVETARLLLYKTAWSIDQGQSATLESSLLKLHISESFLASSIDSMRVHGGYSYIENHVTGRDTRDALGGVLYAGTSDIQRNIIAGMLGL
jgi:alkylation response protein AidB-like acyl-CoA dehydrogenase